VTAERQFLLGLGEAAPCRWRLMQQCSGQQSAISLTGLVASTMGRKSFKVTWQGTDPFELGNRIGARSSFPKALTKS
jgi:hypothetical protein